MKTIVLPGLGADSRMFPPPSYDELPDVDFVDWPAYTGEKTIRELADSIITNYKITRDMTIGGASLGGMVAIETAKILSIDKVLLIGSTTTPALVNPALEKLSSLAEITPIHFIQMFIDKVHLDGMHVAISMFKQSDPDFIRAMCRAIFKWEGKGKYNGTIRQIHGSADKVIFPPDQDAQIIEGGGHIISMTHGEIVADFIAENIR